MSKFEEGKSGNPLGRPKGIVDRRAKLRNLLIPHAEALVNKVVELALGGEVGALKLCLERIMPKIRNEPAAFTLPFNDVKNVNELLANNAAIIAAASCGELTLEQAQTFSSLLETQHKIIANSELEQRLAAIEMTLKEKRNNEKH